MNKHSKIEIIIFEGNQSHNMPALVQRWRKCLVSSGPFEEKCFVAENILY